MNKYRNKQDIIEAARWRIDGDCKGIVHMFHSWKSIASEARCEHCQQPMYDHGWIDACPPSSEDGYMVCPGDWIIHTTEENYYPYKPDLFVAMFVHHVKEKEHEYDDNGHLDAWPP